MLKVNLLVRGYTLMYLLFLHDITHKPKIDGYCMVYLFDMILKQWKNVLFWCDPHGQHLIW